MTIRLARVDPCPLGARARALVNHELTNLLRWSRIRGEFVTLAEEPWQGMEEAVERLALIAEFAWVSAADELATPVPGARPRVDLLLRAGSLACLLRTHIDLLECEPIGAERLLTLAERVAWGNYPERHAVVGSRQSGPSRWWASLRRLLGLGRRSVSARKSCVESVVDENHSWSY